MKNSEYVQKKLQETIKYWQKQLEEGRYIDDSDEPDMIDEDFVFDPKAEPLPDSDAEVAQLLAGKTTIDIRTIPLKAKRRLKSIDIPETVTVIGNDAFNGCNALEHVYIPATVTSIGRRAFQGCENLSDLDIEYDDSELIEIGDAAFASCISLKEVVLPWNMEKIGKMAFAGCYRLKTINIPSGVESIGQKAFSNCEALEDITFNGKTESDVIAIENFPFGLTKKKVISLAT